MVESAQGLGKKGGHKRGSLPALEDTREVRSSSSLGKTQGETAVPSALVKKSKNKLSDIVAEKFAKRREDSFPRLKKPISRGSDLGDAKKRFADGVGMQSKRIGKGSKEATWEKTTS